jgi:hypothetical protein
MMLTRRRTLFTATGLTRRVSVGDDGQMTIAVRTLAWWAMGRRRTEGRPQQVSFPLWAIQGGWFRLASRWWPGALQLDVPGANDPWRRRSDRQRKKGTYPKTRPHRIRFTRRQEPAFVRLATEIGMDQ